MNGYVSMGSLWFCRFQGGNGKGVGDSNIESEEMGWVVSAQRNQKEAEEKVAFSPASFQLGHAMPTYTLLIQYLQQQKKSG